MLQVIGVFPDVADEDGDETGNFQVLVLFRAADHQLVRPVVIVKGKAPKDMKNKEDFWEVMEVVPGEPLMQSPESSGCKLGDYT